MCDIINKKRLFIVLIVVFSIFIGYKKTSLIALADNSSEIVIESSTNRVLYEQNARSKKYMASTTKILTAITIIENVNVDDVVKVTSKTVGIEGSSIYLEEGEELSVKELLYGLMLASGNDCAETLAVYCSGSKENFANLMNVTAKKIGANNSNFVTPHGLHDDNHYTTAYDLAIISSYAMKNEIFREIVNTKSIDISFSTRNYKRHLVNKNKMLREFEGSNGIKTGYTKKAGRCLVSSCIKNGMEIICVVLNCPPMFEKSKQLLTNAFNNYNMYKLVESDNIIDFITIDGKNYATHIKKDIILPLTKYELDNIEILYEYDENYQIPIKSDQKIGAVLICCKNNLLFNEKIYTI